MAATKLEKDAAREIIEAGFSLDDLREAYSEVMEERRQKILSSRRQRYADAIIDYFDALGVFPKQEQQRDKETRVNELINIIRVEEDDFINPQIPNQDKFDDIMRRWLGQ